MCSACLKNKDNIALLKAIVSCRGNKKFYPHRVYPFCSLISALEVLIERPDFLVECNRWRKELNSSLDNATDIYTGTVWKELQSYEDTEFLSREDSIAFILNVDWFQPYKHRTYSVGVIYLAIANLPRSIRFKRENIILVGVIPGPSEPSKTMNSYLVPLVSDLLSLWGGVNFVDSAGVTHFIRCALICVATDLPAGRKCCGFLSFSANLGCSRCLCQFSTGTFGINDYSGFNRSTWENRSKLRHMHGGHSAS